MKPRLSQLLELTLLVLTVTYHANSVSAAENQFKQFFGHWTLKDSIWQQQWDGKTTETLTIENHHTHCAPLNTKMSVLCVVEAPSLKGHILWSLDPLTNEVHHLSSFGEQRIGVGKGRLDELGNLALKVVFPSEGAGTYREYRYRWVTSNEYTLHSKQYKDGVHSGNFYAGRFVKMGVQDEQQQ